jgi:hypothetical protein
VNSKLVGVRCNVGWDLKLLPNIQFHKIKTTVTVYWLDGHILDHFNSESNIQDGVIVQLALFIGGNERFQILHYDLK